MSEADNDVGQDAGLEGWRALLGEKPDDYLAPLQRWLASGRRWTASWNWGAFAFSSAWFVSRRMYGYAVANLLVLALAWQLFRWFDWEWLPPYAFDGIQLNVLCAVLVATFVVLPIFANSIYFRWLDRRRERVAPARLAPNHNTLGLAIVTAILAIAIVLVSLAAIFSEQGSQLAVTGAIGRAAKMRSDIGEFHKRHGRLPDAGEAAPMTPQRPFKEIKWIRFDAQQGAIVLAVGAVNKVFRQKEGRVVLTPEIRPDGLRWRCQTENIAPRYVPVRCRG